MKRRWFANADIPCQILSLLSAKTLHHLKYVSREWHDLISDRSFIVFQIKKEEPVSGFFFQEVFEWADGEAMQSISYIPVGTVNVNVHRAVLSFLPESIVILSLNNGLVCCRSCFPISEPSIYICNPLNKQYVTLPWPNLPVSTSVALVFDPIQNPIETFTDFLLVAVSHVEMQEDEFGFLFDIYSSKERSWKKSKESCQCNQKLAKNKGMLVGGKLYWLTEGSEILMFDPENELSWLIMPPIPVEGFDNMPEMCIGELEGKLHCVIISVEGVQLWIIDDEFASQWSLNVSLSLEELEKANADVLYNVKNKVAGHVSKETDPWLDPLAFKDGMMLVRASTNVYLYKFETGRMRKLCDIETLGPKSMYSPIVVPYAMSLVPLE